MPGLLSFVSVSWEFASDYSGCINIGTKSNSDHGKQARKTWDGVRCLIYLCISA